MGFYLGIPIGRGRYLLHFAIGFYPLSSFHPHFTVLKIAVKRITLASPLSKRYVPALPHVSVRGTFPELRLLKPLVVLAPSSDVVDCHVRHGDFFR